MNGQEQFERQLQRHPQRRLPASWREEILIAAKAVQPRQAAPLESSPEASDLVLWLRRLLWPAPRAWAGLAAVWAVVLALNLGSREASRDQTASRVLPSSPQMRELLREQGELFAELAGPRGSGEATKPPLPQPRSQRRPDCAMA